MEDKIIQGDCLEKMKELQAESIDLVVTDPPYGYSFMGKDWDKAIVGIPTWRECLKVLKPGGFAFVMSAPRQDVLARMMINLADAGFETGFTSIYWAYATGFPKAMNMGKAVDKKLGLERKIIGYNEEWVNKNKTNVISGQSNMNKNAQLKGLTNSEAGFQNPQKIGEITEPASKEAKKLEGSYAGYQPKPAVEVIIVCMKPLNKKNYVEQSLYNGKGITWLNDCRIPYTSEADMPSTHTQGDRGDDTVFNKKTCGFNQPVELAPSPDGRFPANLLVSDDVFSEFQDKGTKPHLINAKEGTKEGNREKGWGTITVPPKNYVGNYGDAGSFSRYFDLDKWWANFIVTPKPSKSEKNKGLENFESKPMGLNAKNRVYTDKCATCKLKFIGGEPRCHCPPELKITDKENGYQYKNTHPTVKPIKLMSYLITLGSREGDVVLDPFMGSGTTCLSASLLQRKYIGIEREEEYCKIAEGRLNGLHEQSNIR